MYISIRGLVGLFVQLVGISLLFGPSSGRSYSIVKIMRKQILIAQACISTGASCSVNPPSLGGYILR